MHSRYTEINNFVFSATDAKATVFEEVRLYLSKLSLKIISEDQMRPWGGFYVIDEKDANHFISLFFPEIDIQKKYAHNKISPKILILSPEKKLSWQYHHRRSELWKVIYGNVGVVISDDDLLNEMVVKKPDEIISIKKEQRHRLIGLDNWAIIAEIWEHADAQNPSDEDDIVRVEDDFGR